MKLTLTAIYNWNIITVYKIEDNYYFLHSKLKVKKINKSDLLIIG